jgi:hypothetical protein
MIARISMALFAALLLASCTTSTPGLLPFPVWRPQVTDASFSTDGARGASVSVDWRTGKAPFTVDIEMPGEFEQVLPITTSERNVTLSGLDFLVPEGTSGLHTYTAKIRVVDSLGQTFEKDVTADFDFPAMEGDSDIIPPPAVH